MDQQQRGLLIPKLAQRTRDENLKQEIMLRQQKMKQNYIAPGQLQQVPPRLQAQIIVTQQGQSAGGVMRTQQTFTPQVGQQPLNVRHHVLVQQGQQPRMQQQMIQPGAIQQQTKFGQQKIQLQASGQRLTTQHLSQQQLEITRQIQTNPHFVSISEIDAKSSHRSLRKDVIIARCTWQTDLKTSRSKDYIFARVNLLDGFNAMDQIRCTAFDDLSHRLLSQIKVGAIIGIQNFEVQKANKRHSAFPHDCEISLHSSSKIFALKSESTIPYEMIFSFTPLSAIAEMPPLCIDIKGVLVKVSDLYIKFSFWQNKSWTMRDFWLIDESKYIIKISLWEANARSFSGTIGEVHRIHCLKKTVNYGRQYVNIQMCSNHVTSPGDDTSKILHSQYESTPDSFTVVSLPAGSCVSRHHFDLARSYLDDGGDDMTQRRACALASVDLGINVDPSDFSKYMKQFRPSRVYTPRGDDKYELVRDYQEQSMSQNEACKAAAKDLGFTISQGALSAYLIKNEFPSSTVQAPFGDEKYELARKYYEQGWSQRKACEKASLALGYSVDQGHFSRYMKKHSSSKQTTVEFSAKKPQLAKKSIDIVILSDSD